MPNATTSTNQLDLDMDGYVIDDEYQHNQHESRRGTITARTAQGALYAVPLEDSAVYAVPLELEEGAGGAAEHSKADTNTNTNTTISISMPRTQKHQRSVYLGFGGEETNETDDV